MIATREQIIALAAMHGSINNFGCNVSLTAESLESFYHASRKLLEEEIERLVQCNGDIHKIRTGYRKTISELHQKLAAANSRISELEAHGEPVAWTAMSGHGRVLSLTTPVIQPELWEPLYLRATQAVPLTVKVADMRESNGRVTWSVFLAKSPDDALWDCHQVYSDSIEGRARYEAAVLNHFLGNEPAPDILAFDTDAPAPQAVPEGWKLVPIEPTPEMIDAFIGADPERESVWQAMLAAAP